MTSYNDRALAINVFACHSTKTVQIQISRTDFRLRFQRTEQYVVNVTCDSPNVDSSALCGSTAFQSPVAYSSFVLRPYKFTVLWSRRWLSLTNDGSSVLRRSVSTGRVTQVTWFTHRPTSSNDCMTDCNGPDLSRAVPSPSCIPKALHPSIHPSIQLDKGRVTMAIWTRAIESQGR